ncbi:MAG: TetR/AcrR family transcriptional regulator C-terminal domain-containing protein [Acidimicrobiales bacterium]
MGRPLQIDRISVLEAGLRIADEDGLQAVTMQGVAGALCVTPMALYRHVANKADLLDGLVELLLTDVPLPPDTMAWRERLEWMGQAVRGAAQRHPAVFALLLQRPAATAGALVVRDAVYQALREAGVAEPEVARTERVISTAILGFAGSEAGGRFGSRSRQEVDADFAAVEAMVSAYLDQVCGVSRPSVPSD